MSYADLRKLKKVEEVEVKKASHRFLVVGSDLFAIATYKMLVDKHGKDEVRLLAQKPISEENLTFKGPFGLRGSANISSFIEDYPQVKLTSTEKVSSFYKEMKFRPFGGRAKSEALLEGEDFFINPRATFELSDLFPFLKDENLLESINEGVVQYIPTGVNSDVEEGFKWTVFCSNGTQVSCEELYWAESPYTFFELHKNKNGLSDGLVEFCEQTKTNCSLNIKLIFDKPLTDMDETLFLPLSYTHEWGHFIGEFSKVSEESEKQIADFVMFVNKNETSEEEISRKIRILKKNLEKIFPNFKEISAEEFISLNEKTTSLKIDDLIFDENAQPLQNFKFVGLNAPVAPKNSNGESYAYSLTSLANLARGAKNLSQLREYIQKN